MAPTPDRPDSSAHGLTRLVVPATHEHLRVIRLTAVAAATPVDADLDEADDLRLAVGEACAVLIECAVPARERPDLIEVTIRGGDGVRIRAERPYARFVHPPSSISVAILDTACDRWCLVRGPVVILEWNAETGQC